MAQQQSSCGTLLSYDITATEVPPGLPAYKLLGLVEMLTAPPRVREMIDAPTLDDCGLDVQVPGREAVSDFVFMHYWDPEDEGAGTQQDLETLFDSSAKIAWQITYPTTTPKSEQFMGQVIGLEPQENANETTLRRQITVRRTSDIVRGDAVAPT